MVTGKLPFNGQDAFAVLAALTLEEPTGVWDINPDVPWPVGKIINQLLSKDPDDRPANATETVRMLLAIENELRNPAEYFAPPPKDHSRPPPSQFDAELGAFELVDDADAVEVDDLEILPDDDEPAQPAPVLPAKRLKELTGHSLGAYDIGPLVGQGQHGLVFRARDRRNGQTVALKVLSPEFPKNDEETHVFTQAMGTAIPLRHPNLVSLYGAGKTGPYCWTAQEFVEGKSLAQVLQDLEKSPKSSFHLGVRVTYHITQCSSSISRTAWSTATSRRKTSCSAAPTRWPSSTTFGSSRR